MHKHLFLFFLAVPLFLSIAGCSRAPTEETTAIAKRSRLQRSLSSKFEWAVQHYEAGAYVEAVKGFEGLKKEGAEVPEFDLIPFFLGMSHFRLGQLPAATGELESFLRKGIARAESQDARITLLLTYEAQNRWKDVSSLAAESDKLTLFHYNRTVLKLVWARALTELGEMLGAKAVLEDAMAFLDKAGEEQDSTLYSHPNQDLWGRYHFTQVLLEAKECGLSEPKEIQKKKRLYVPWADSVTDCLRAALTHSANELFAKESQWSSLAEASLMGGMEDFAQKISGFLKKESPVLERHRALQKSSREALYRLLGTLDEHLINFKNRGFNPSHLERLRKRIDHLLVGISGPS